MKVYKYILPTCAISEIEMPKHADILHVNLQREKFCIWAVVDTEETEHETRRFRIAGTGHPLEIAPYEYQQFEYIGTVFVEELVFHVFEIDEPIA